MMKAIPVMEQTIHPKKQISSYGMIVANKITRRRVF